MAIFNPSVPQTNDPNWLSYSKSISQPEGDKSAGVALQGIGNVVGDALKATDQLVKFSLDDQIHAAVDKERSDYMTTLKATYGKVAASGAPPVSSPDVLTDENNGDGEGDGSEAPEDLKTIPGAIDSLKGGRSNGRLSQTDYYGRLDALAKDFRSRYPGYVDYIDRQFEKNAGVNPANAQMRSLIGDINSYATSKTAGVNKAISAVMANPFPGGDKVIAGLLDGSITPAYAYSKAYGGALRKAEYEENHRAQADYEGDMKVRGMQAQKAATGYASQVMWDNIDTMKVVSMPDQPKVMQFIGDLRGGKLGSVTDEQMLALGQAIDANRSSSLAGLKAYFDQPIPGRKDKLSTTALVGKEGMDAVYAEATRIHDQLLIDVAGKNKENALAAMYNHATLSQMRMKDALWMLQNDPKMGDYVTAMGAFNAAGGPDFAMAMEKSVLLNELSKNLNDRDKANFLAGVHQLIGQPKMTVGPGGQPTGPNTTSNEANDPRIVTLGNVIDRINKAGRDGGSASPDDRKALSEAVSKLPKLIAASPAMVPDSVKVRLINIAFGPQSRGFISKFTKEEPDPNNPGRMMSGQMKVFTDMTTPEITKEIYRLSQHDTQLWDNYRSWAEGEFGSRGLFKDELQNLNNIPQIPNSSVTYYPAKEGKPAYFGLNVGSRTNVNLSEYRYRPEEFSGSQFSDPFQKSYQTVIAIKDASITINRLNDGLRSMSSIATYYGDMNGYLVRTMLALGLDAAAGGIPKDIYDSVTKSAPPVLKPTGKKKNGSTSNN